MLPILFAPLLLAAPAPPTFAKDIAPILYAHCASCHRPGEVGPFALLSYGDARKRAGQVADVTGRKLMPPWKPDRGHGVFKDARVLTDAQIATIRQWADAGAPEGDPADAPPVPQFPTGWHLGEPDLILEAAEPFRIPAEGEDLYVHYVLPTGLTADKYILATQVLPSNKRVAHHGVPILDAKGGTAATLTKNNGGKPYVQFGGPGFLPRGFLPGYAPGMTIHRGSDDQLITLGKDIDIVLQMHYHPTGKVEYDRPRVGLYFTDKKPLRNPSAVLLGTNDIDIPAGAARYTRTDSFRLPADYEFRTVFAHMHMVGKSVKVWAELPGGARRDLLAIDDWDFNWQDTYIYKNPFVLPKGTVVKAEFVWDNSSDHPRNPHSPPARIRLGENSTDEMAGVILAGLPVRPRDEGLHWYEVILHHQLRIDNPARRPKK